MNNLTIRKFNGTDVGFRINQTTGASEVRIDEVAKFCGWTEIAKSGNECIKWIRVNKYLTELGASTQVATGNFIPEYIMYPLIGKANNERATKFMLWVGQVLTEIRQTGRFKLPGSYKEALLQLVQAEEEKEVLVLGNKQKDQLIGELKPRADYTDNILKNTGLVTITQISKDYGMTAQEMNALLHDLKIQYKQSDQWLIYATHHNNGYTHSETIPIVRSDGRKDIKMNTKWTQKGRLFLYNLLKDNGVLPTIEHKEAV